MDTEVTTEEVEVEEEEELTIKIDQTTKTDQLHQRWMVVIETRVITSKT